MPLPTRGSGRNHRTTAEICRPRRGRNRRTPMILAGKVLAILHGSVLMLSLHRQFGSMRLPHIGFLLRAGPHMHTAVAAVVGNTVVIHDHSAVVDVGDIGHADVVDRAVVVEAVVAPFTAVESIAGVAVAIVNAAIEAHMRPPIASMPSVESVIPAPPSRSPKHSDRCHDPGSGHPVIAVVIAPCPISGRPDHSGPGAHGLRVYG